MRARILTVARKMFTEKGFSGTSIRDIGGELGISISNIYYYYGSKEGIIRAILDDTYKTLYTHLREATSQETDPIERLRKLIKSNLRLVNELHSTSKIFWVTDQEELSSETLELSRRVQREVLGLYVEALQDLADHGVINPRHTTLLALNVSGVVNWLLRWYREDGPLPFDVISDEIVHFIFHGISIPPELDRQDAAVRETGQRETLDREQESELREELDASPADA